MQLNEAQYEAVHHITGPMLVTAGPGSGKTRVITERIKYLTGEKNINPQSILVVTFTRAAANEMKQRYAAGRGKPGVMFGTFHSIFFTILKNAYKYSSEDILTESELRQFIKAVLPRLDWKADNEKDTVTDIITEISRVKSGNYDIDSYYPMACPAENFRRLYTEYDRWLKKNHKIDFDDMLIYTYELFVARKDILALWQNKFRYILVDEFQDINMLQYEVLKLLALPENNLFIVGDDDQSIYSFRGSKPEYMLEFDTVYPDAKRVLLGVNYRCQANVIEAAGKLIAHNKIRIAKDIIAGVDAGIPVDICGYKTLHEQNEQITDIIRKHHDGGGMYGDIAILYRTNMQPQTLIHNLMEYDIPVRLKEGIPNIYAHWIAGDIIAYVKLALGMNSPDNFLRVMNRPNRYISRSVIDSKRVDYDRLLMMYEDKPWMLERIYQMRSDIKAISRMTPARGIRYIDKIIGYGDYLCEYAGERDMDADSLRDKFEEIADMASGFRHYGDWLDYIDEYSENLKNNRSLNEAADAVMCMTMHGSKGLEFDSVIIPDVNEGIIPHSMSTADEQIEEERRLLYVAMTRAKSSLHMFYCEHRYNRDCDASRFIEELTE